MIRKSLQALRLLTAIMVAAVTPAMAAREPSLTITTDFVFWGSWGQCSFQFVLDGTGGDPGGSATMSNVIVYLAALDRNGNSMAPLALNTKAIGGDNADRYDQVTVEGPCDAEKFLITGGKAIIAGKSVDLLKADAFRQLLPGASVPVEIAAHNSGSKP